MIYAILEIDPITHDGDRRVKIGFTNSPSADERVASCQTGNSRQLAVIATRHGTQADERELHSRFKSLRIAGEWFWFRDELFAEVNTWTQIVGERRRRERTFEYGLRPPGKRLRSVNVPQINPADELHRIRISEEDKKWEARGRAILDETMKNAANGDAANQLYERCVSGLLGRRIRVA